MPQANGAHLYDIVLFGASGFVGRQAAAYFAQHAPALRWALAGRSREKLAAVRHACGADGAGIIVADAADSHALEQLVARTRVVLNTAGPFALHGSKLVAACVHHGTHYVDITGETPWVRRMIDAHHAEAARRGARIVPGCGFDSVPSDLGAWLVAQALRREHDELCTSVKACFSLRGGFNGGTLHSALNMLESGDKARWAEPFLLNPPGTVPVDASTDADPLAPHHDAHFNAWVGPFFMGPVNTRVVRRSAALLAGTPHSPFAPGFSYQEYLRFGRGPAAALAAAAVSAASLAVQGALAFSPARKMAAAMAPAPGDGPSERAMERGFFRCELVATGERGSMLRGCIAGQGDPGNRATTVFVCESALALVLNAHSLPGGAHFGGVLTPATAIGDVLARRLQVAGMTVEPTAPAGA
jgi:short subunit dehydrogenase-like uncharacterized protein